MWLGDLQALDGNMAGVDEPKLQQEAEEEAEEDQGQLLAPVMRRQRSVQEGVYGEGQEELEVADPAELDELSKAAAGLESRILLRTMQDDSISQPTIQRVGPIRLCEEQYAVLFRILGEGAFKHSDGTAAGAAGAATDAGPKEAGNLSDRV